MCRGSAAPAEVGGARRGFGRPWAPPQPTGRPGSPPPRAGAGKKGMGVCTRAVGQGLHLQGRSARAKSTPIRPPHTTQGGVKRGQGPGWTGSRRLSRAGLPGVAGSGRVVVNEVPLGLDGRRTAARSSASPPKGLEAINAALGRRDGGPLEPVCAGGPTHQGDATSSNKTGGRPRVFGQSSDGLRPFGPQAARIGQGKKDGARSCDDGATAAAAECHRGLPGVGGAEARGPARPAEGSSSRPHLRGRGPADDRAAFGRAFGRWKRPETAAHGGSTRGRHPTRPDAKRPGTTPSSATRNFATQARSRAARTPGGATSRGSAGSTVWAIEGWARRFVCLPLVLGPRGGGAGPGSGRSGPPRR